MQPEVAEALKMCLERGKFKGVFPDNHGGEWTREADKELCDLFDRGMREDEIGIALKRSRSSIHSRLVKIGKVKSKRASYFAK